MVRLVLDAVPVDFFVGGAILDIGKTAKIESWSLFRGIILRDSKQFYAKIIFICTLQHNFMKWKSLCLY